MCTYQAVHAIHSLKEYELMMLKLFSLAVAMFLSLAALAAINVPPQSGDSKCAELLQFGSRIRDRTNRASRIPTRQGRDG